MPNAYDLHCLRPGAEMMIFVIFTKDTKIIENDANIKIESMEITENLIFQFSTLRYGPGNQLFPVLWGMLKITKNH